MNFVLQILISSLLVLTQFYLTPVESLCQNFGGNKTSEIVDFRSTEE